MATAVWVRAEGLPQTEFNTGFPRHQLDVFGEVCSLRLCLLVSKTGVVIAFRSWGGRRDARAIPHETNSKHSEILLLQI